MTQASELLAQAMGELLNVVADEAERTGAGYGGLLHLSFNQFAENLRSRASALATKEK